MIDNDDSSFRVQARFNRIEYAELEDDLKRYAPGAERSGRIRLLMRLGLAVANGRMPAIPPGDHAPQLAQVVDIHRSDSKKAETPAQSPSVPEPVQATESIDALESMGLHPNSFNFGTPA